jgi:hypothetical protein
MAKPCEACQPLKQKQKAGYRLNGTRAIAFIALRFRGSRALIQAMY